MLQERMLDSYAFYGELNWDRKTSVVLFFLTMLAALSQVLLQREIRCRN